MSGRVPYRLRYFLTARSKVQSLAFIYQLYVRQKTVRTTIFTRGSAFINLYVSVQISRQARHCVRNLESVWIRAAAEQHLKKSKNNDLNKPQTGH